MTRLTIELPDALHAFVAEQTARGGHASPDQYVLKLIREARHRAGRERLEALLLEGLNSGEPIPVDDEYWARIRREVEERLAERRSAVGG